MRIENFQNVVIGSGVAAKLLVWTLAGQGQKTAVIAMAGGSCPYVACLPSKNIIHSAKAVSLVHPTRGLGSLANSRLFKGDLDYHLVRASMVLTTMTIIPFMPDGWDAAAGFPAMKGNVAFLMKDVVLFAVSVYLLKQDVVRATLLPAAERRQGQGTAGAHAWAGAERAAMK